MAKILVVDDSDIIRDQLKDMLSGQGHEVIDAVDGADGFEKAKAEKVDLIIVDYNMPKKNGIEMAQAVRTLPEYQATHILMLTTEAGTELKKKGKEVGIRAWIVKPPNGDIINKCITKLLAKAS